MAGSRLKDGGQVARKLEGCRSRTHDPTADTRRRARVASPGLSVAVVHWEAGG